MHDLLRCAWRELTRRKARTASNICGYILAVSIMVVLVTVLLLAKSAGEYVLTNVGTHFIVYAPYMNEETVYTAENPGCCIPYIKRLKDKEHEGFVSNTITTRLFTAWLVDEAKKIPEVKDASPYLMFRFRDNGDGHLFTVGGFLPGNNVSVWNNACAPGDIVEGKFITPSDRGCVILEEAYSKDRKLKVGDKVIVANRDFYVKGIVNPPIRPAKADIYMTFDDSVQVISERLKTPLTDKEFNLLLVEAKSGAVQKEAMDSIKKLISGESVISTYGCYKPATKYLGMNEKSVWLLMVIIGAAVIVLSLKTQYSAVIERRHDIGILKIIGWTNWNIVFQILIESVVQSVTGGILGSLLAVIVLAAVPVRQLINVDFPLKMTISWMVLGLGLLLALVGGIIAGIIPALHAAGQKPAEVLRRV